MNHRCTILLCALLGGAVDATLAAEPAATPAAESAAQPAPLISQADLLALIAKKDPDLVVLDVRTAAEYAAGHVPGARNVSHDQLAGSLGELASLKDKQVVLYCRSGRRTLLAEQTLRAAGFSRLLHLQGDFLDWEAKQQPVER